MTLDTHLLEKARDARDQIIELEYEAERARLSYQHAIRRLHASGGSLREIADALGISHQRVHQIVDGAEGKVVIREARPRRSWRRRTEIACSFCGQPKEEGRQVIAGPGAVFVCAGCVEAAGALVSDGGATSEGRHLGVASDTEQPCSFCGRRTHAETDVVQAGDARICRDCLMLCDKILVETGGKRG